MKFLTNIDLTHNELQNFKVQNLGTNPSSNHSGAMYYNTATKKLMINNGTAWSQVGQIIEKSSNNGSILVDGTEVGVYTHPGSGTNPHGTTKADLGLGSVENKSSATIRGEITSSNVVSALGFPPKNVQEGAESAGPLIQVAKMFI